MVVENGIAKCLLCDRPYPTKRLNPEKHNRQCIEKCGQENVSKEPRKPNVLEPPPLLRRGFNFVQALAKHVGDGMRQRTQEEINDILENHCKGCPFFNGTVCTHNKCGCKVNAGKVFFNKLAWKSEKCPDGRWE